MKKINKEKRVKGKKDNTSNQLGMHNCLKR